MHKTDDYIYLQHEDKRERDLVLMTHHPTNVSYSTYLPFPSNGSKAAIC